MRLIDADSFLKEIINRCGCIPYVHGRNGETIYLNNLIDEHPVAYDFDRVIQQLEKHETEISSRKERDILNTIAKANAKATIEEDIEIVKSGF